MSLQLFDQESVIFEEEEISRYHQLNEGVAQAVSLTTQKTLDKAEVSIQDLFQYILEGREQDAIDFLRRTRI